MAVNLAISPRAALMVGASLAAIGIASLLLALSIDGSGDGPELPLPSVTSAVSVVPTASSTPASSSSSSSTSSSTTTVAPPPPEPPADTVGSGVPTSVVPPATNSDTDPDPNDGLGDQGDPSSGIPPVVTTPGQFHPRGK